MEDKQEAATADDYDREVEEVREAEEAEQWRRQHPWFKDRERVGPATSGDAEASPAAVPAVAHVRVIDIPMRWGPGLPAPVVAEEEFERCSYVGPADRKCGRRASEKGLCTIHARWERWTAWGWPITCPEDRESVQETLRQTMCFLMAGHINEKQALAVVAICRAILRTL